MSTLAQFLSNDSNIDRQIVDYMTKTVQLESLSDFANFWTSSDYERGVQNDIVTQVPGFQDASRPASRVQIARLRAAWKKAQDQSSQAPMGTTTATSAGGPVGMGWTSPTVTSTNLDGLWAAMVYKARNPQKFMDVSNVTVVDRPGFIARSMTINPNGKRSEEHIYANEKTGEMIYRQVDPDTKQETEDERVIAVKENPLRMEFFHRHVSDGYRVYWQAPVGAVQGMVQELINYAASNMGKGDAVGLGVRSAEITGVSHDALWRSIMSSIRDPARFYPCSGVSIVERQGFVQRTLTANGQPYDENIYDDEQSSTIVFRKLKNGSETDVERVVVLRTNPLQIEFHMRNKADGFRVDCDMPKSAALSSVEAFVREARRMEGATPSTIGYGITSDPIRDVTSDHLFAATQIAVKEPWRVIGVDQSSCQVQDCAGFLTRKMRLSATGEMVTERITISEEKGEVTYNKCDASGRPSDVERVLAIRNPLRLEFYERSARSGMRVNWTAPYSMARDTFSNIVQIAKKIKSNSSDTIGYGVASKPLSAGQDSLWKAMLFAMRNPADAGLKVTNVNVRDMSGFMQRSMCIVDKPGSPTVTDNVRVIESSQEITYRPVINGMESGEERVFALRTDPMRFEMFCRNSGDGMRMDWSAPRSLALPVFDSALAVAQRSGGGVSASATGASVGMGWTSPAVTTCSSDGLWAAMVYKARNPQKFMDVSNVTVADRQGFIARGMTITPTGKRVEEHIYANERTGEMVYRLVDPSTKQETDDERVMAVRDGPLRIEFFHRHKSDGYRAYWQAPVDTVQKMIQELVDYASKNQGQGADVGLGVRSAEIKGVSHDSMWRSMMESIREPARFFPCSGVSIQEKQGYVQRTLTANGETYTENIYDDEASCEIVYRKLSNGAETDLERVVALRTHPLQVEFHLRNKNDGFRVQWNMSKSVSLSAADAFVREAKRMDSVPPTVIGYGITSDPVRDVSYDDLFAAAQLSVKEPWRAINVDQGSVDVQECTGYVQRKMTLRASGERVTERVTINEEMGEIRYNKCDSYGTPGDVERVLAIHTPLRIEFYERSARSGLRVHWKAPYQMAQDTFSNLVQVAKGMTSSSGATVGFGLASKPLDGMSQDAVWRAMLTAMRDPVGAGMKVDSVRVQDMSGYMQRSMRLLEKPGSPTVTDNIRVMEGAREILYRPVKNGQESEEERVFALRTEPLRFEMFCRHARDKMRFDWTAPRSVAISVFDSTAAVARRM